MRVQSVRFKKSFVSNGTTLYFHIAVVKDDSGNTYEVEFRTTGQQQNDFVSGQMACFEVIYVRHLNYEVKYLGRPNDSQQTASSAEPISNANFSMSGAVLDRDDTLWLEAMKMATSIHVARVQTTALDGTAQELDQLFGLAESIYAKLCMAPDLFSEHP